MDGKIYINPTQDAGKEFVMRKIQGSVVMLNLLRFRAVADYSENPELSPEEPISGKQAYQIYIDETLPYLNASGGEILFLGKGGPFLIGPPDENWDYVMLIRQHNVDSFLGFASNEGYLKIVGHRTAALQDSRLLPITDLDVKDLLFTGG